MVKTKAKRGHLKGIKRASGAGAAEGSPTRAPLTDFLNKKQQKRVSHSKRKLQRKETVHGGKRQRDDGEVMSNLERELDRQDQSPIKAAVHEVKSNKMTKAVAIREVARMRLVLEHPSFREDPWGAVQNHLRHVLRARQETVA